MLPVGTTFSFTLNEPATVRMAFVGRRAGRVVKGTGKCVAENRGNAHGRSCSLGTKTDGTLTFTGRSARNRVSFEGRISSSNRLKHGRYTLVVTATTAGKTSRPERIGFTIAG